tara:strand:+ start:953 stop:2515 length:1563 start_codon:yes stop_codon:yes gene_type:complete
MSVQVSYKKQTFLGIIGLLILFLVVETIANVWWFTQVSCEFEENEIFMNMDEEKRRQLCVDLYDVKTSGDELIPNQQNNSVNINSLGFRGEEFSPEKPDDVYRIFTLGGSTMFGHGATSDKTTIPGYLQDFFQNYDDEFKIEIINGGIQGADSSNELNLIENKIIPLNPDLIIVYDGWNDLRAENTPEMIEKNWNSMCDMGQIHKFDVIIALQPIAGFGNKALTTSELNLSRSGTNYNNSPLIDSLQIYEDYSDKLKKLDGCLITLDLRDTFDNEISSIYWDPGHVSDLGNNYVAKRLYDEVISYLPETIPKLDALKNSELPNKNNIEISDNFVKTLLSGYKTPLMLNSILSFESTSPSLPEHETPKSNISKIFKTSSVTYEDTELHISIEIFPDEKDSQLKLMKIKTIDDLNKLGVSNVTYFLKIYNNDELILNDFFYAEDGTLTMSVMSNNYENVEILGGTRQYDHNAFVVSSVNPIEITGPLLLDDEEYEFKIELRTIDDTSNWIFSLNDFTVDVFI